MNKIENYKAGGNFLSIRKGKVAYSHAEYPTYNSKGFYKSDNQNYSGFISYKYPTLGGLYKRICNLDDWELIEVDGRKI